MEKKKAIKEIETKFFDNLDFLNFKSSPKT
jgi:hypothetical protein